MKSKKELIDVLMREFDIEMPEETRKHIDKNFDRYFEDSFIDDLKNTISWKFDAIQYDAESDMEFEKAHENDKVELVKEARVMWFNDSAVPAYWYTENMSEEEISDRLSSYRHQWIKSGAGPVKYPELEQWHELHEWEREFTSEQLEKMERDLECCDTDDAQTLNFLRMMNTPVSMIMYQYPQKIDRILEVTNKFESDNGTRYANIKILLRDGTTCDIRAHASKNGSSAGMEAIGKGFPIMTDQDNKKIEEEVFKDWWGFYTHPKHKI